MPKRPKRRTTARPKKSTPASIGRIMSAQRAWQKVAASFRMLYPFCVLCLCRGVYNTANLVCDHITPHRGDEALFWERSNWQTLCKLCHDKDKARHEAKGKGRAEWFAYLRDEIKLCGTLDLVATMADRLPEHVAAGLSHCGTFGPELRRATGGGAG